MALMFSIDPPGGFQCKRLAFRISASNATHGMAWLTRYWDGNNDGDFEQVDVHVRLSGQSDPTVFPVTAKYGIAVNVRHITSGGQCKMVVTTYHIDGNVVTEVESPYGQSWYCPVSRFQ